MDTQVKRDGRIFWLLLIFLLHIACWLVMKPPVPATDDACYVKCAQDLLKGDYHLTPSPKDHRLAVIAPTAFFISVFGDGPYVISLWPLICSLATIAVLYLFLWSRCGRMVAILAAALLSVNITQVNFSTVLFPDVIVSLFALLVLLLLFERRNEGKIVRNAFLISLFFILGFLSKEIMVLLLPFILILAVADVRNKLNKRFWLSFAFIFTGAILVFIAVYYFFTGSFTFLYDSVRQWHNDVFITPAGGELLKRYTYEPLVWLFGLLGYFPLLLFAVPQAAFLLTERDAAPAMRHFAVYFLLLLGVYWFGTSSFSRFAPIPLFERMWMMLLAPACALTAFSLDELWKDAGSKLTFIMLSFFLAVAAIAFVFVSANRAAFFFLFALVIAGIYFLKGKVKLSITQKVALSILPWFVLLVWFLAHNSRYLVR